MHILFISDNFPPEVNAPATRTYEHCRHWLESGAEITVVTCAPNFPEGRLYDGYRNKLYQTEVMDGIKVVRVWSYMAANKGFAKRILDYVSFSVAATLASLTLPADVIIATSPQFFTSVSGYFLSIFKRKPWIFEVRDLWPQGIRSVEAVKSNFILDMLEKLELFLYRKASLVIPVTPAIKKDIAGRGIDAEKIRVITNGSNLEAFTPREKSKRLIEELELRDKFVIGYIGTHGMSHGLDFIVRAAKGIEDEAIHFVFLGAGSEKQNVVRIAREEGVKNVTFLDPIPKDDVPEFLSVLDVGLVPLRRLPILKKVIPSKIFELASMEKPILLGVEGQAQEIIEAHGAGVCYEPENTVDFLEKLQKLKEDDGVYEACRKGCRELAREYDRKRLAGEMFELIEEVSRS